MEDHHERAATLHHLLPRVQRQQHRQGTDIEDEDAVHHLVGGLGDALTRVVGLGGGNAHQLQATEREHDHCQCHHQAGDAVGEEAAVLPEVGHAGVRAAMAAGQQPGAEADHADDGHHLDQGEPELHLAVDLHLGQVDQVDHHEEDRRRGPGGEAGPPVLHVDTHRCQLGHADQYIHHPVVPARDEAGELAPVLVGEVAEAAGHRLFHHHFAELAHDQEGHQAGNGVAQQDGRAGQLDGLGDAQEQPGTDGPAQRDQLDMAILQPAL
ncbi:hypothetical protein D3C75_656360 [compost metagenome]